MTARKKRVTAAGLADANLKTAALDAKVTGYMNVPTRILDQSANPEACYIARAGGDCQAPAILLNDAVVVCPVSEPRAGDYVVLYPYGDGIPQLKRLDLDLPPFKAVHPDSTAIPIVMCSQSNPPKRYTVPYGKVAAVHKVIGVMRGDTAFTAAELAGPVARAPVAAATL